MNTAPGAGANNNSLANSVPDASKPTRGLIPPQKTTNLLPIRTLMNPRTLITVAICLSPFEFASAVVFDLADDFSATANPNGAWQYGSSTASYPEVAQPFSIYSLPTTRGSAFDFWVHSLQAADPNVFHNDAATAASSFGYTLQPNQAAFNCAGSSSIYRWIAPSAGAYSIQADFVALDGGQPHLYVVSNGTVLFETILTAQDMTAEFDTLQLVDAGAPVDFVLKSAGGFLAVTGIDATITNVPVPEPSSVALLAVGSMLAVLRRTKRSA